MNTKSFIALIFVALASSADAAPTPHNRALNSLKTPLARLPVAREGHLSRSLLNITTRVNDNTTAPVNGNITAPANGVANVSLEGPFDFF